MASTKSKKNTMNEEAMIAKASKLQRQHAYHKEYNTGTYITDKEVVIILGMKYIRYKAGGVEKMRIAREGENLVGLKETTLS